MQYFRSEYIDFLELRFEQGHKALSILSVEYSEKTAQCSCFKEYFSKFISPLDISGYENSWVAMIRNIRLQAYHLGTQLAIQARRAPIREKLIKTRQADQQPL